MTTDVVKKFKNLIPNVPIPPFNRWRKWLGDHENSVHCMVEWRDDKGDWHYSEMRSTHYDKVPAFFRVGGGEFPGTGYNAYGVYIINGRCPRAVDNQNRQMQVTLDEVVACDYRKLEAEIRRYGIKNRPHGTPETASFGKYNCGLGGPAYKPSQNSNTMIKYVLRACGVNREAPQYAVGWDTEPYFPWSTDSLFPKLDSTP